MPSPPGPTDAAAVQDRRWEAVQSGEDARVRSAIRAGAAVHARGTEGATPLHLAVAAGHAAVVEALLGAGADPSARTTGEVTPPHVAAERGDDDVVRLLLRAGARSSSPRVRT